MKERIEAILSTLKRRESLILVSILAVSYTHLTLPTTSRV